MSTDWVEKEREFLSSLQADTGRDLAAWMAMIRAQDLPHRNDIIDWLRQQGFTFSRASWLERIHNNGGRPIYLDPAEILRFGATPLHAPAPPPVAPEPVPAPLPPPAAPAAAPPVPAQAPPDGSRASRVAVPPRGADDGDLDALLAKAKAYRPLAQYILREIQVVLPDVAMRAEASYVSLANPREFAVLAISPKELRLGLDLGDAPARGGLEPGRFPPVMARAAARMSHMVVLNDARQVDDALLALVCAASRRCNA